MLLGPRTKYDAEGSRTVGGTPFDQRLHEGAG
jgi:hypothetical protein